MTQPTAGQPLTDEQAAFLRAEAARQAADESAGITGATADVASQMTERGPLLPAEEQMDALMAQLKAQSEMIASLTSKVGVVQRQMEEAQAASGGPLAIRYAQAAVDKLAAYGAQWPAHDLSAARTAADNLLSAAQAAVKGDAQSPGALHAAASAISRITRKLPHIDWSAVIDDIELAVEEGAKLLAVA